MGTIKKTENSSAIHTLKLPLDLSDADKQMFNKRFHAMVRLHNILVKHALFLFDKLKKNEVYQSYHDAYCELKKKEIQTKADCKIMKKLSKEMSEIYTSIGLTEYFLQSYILKGRGKYKKLISSHELQKEATRVWRGVETVLFGNGKELHYLKFMEAHSICGKSDKSGVRYNRVTRDIYWQGKKYNVVFPTNTKELAYVNNSINHTIKYCEILREPFNNGWKYYVNIYLAGSAPTKFVAGLNTIGIDIGPSTIAAVSQHPISVDEIWLKEIAPKANAYNKAIVKLQRQMDHSRRLSNPNNYNADGTVKRGKKRWFYTKNYRRMRAKLKTLYRKKSAYIRNWQGRFCNLLLHYGRYFYIEKMNFKGLQRRAKKTERSEKPSEVKKKDGTTKVVCKYKRKKRFGRSLNNRAPAQFVTMLKRKAQLYGGWVREVNTTKYKASQYDHIQDICVKVTLSQRTKLIGGYEVQRDLYSAFLIANPMIELNEEHEQVYERVNRKTCSKRFSKFVEVQTKLISAMKAEGISKRGCFGF